MLFEVVFKGWRTFGKLEAVTKVGDRPRRWQKVAHTN
jgi:hypothetical protein